MGISLKKDIRRVLSEVKVLWLFPPMGKGFPNVSQYRFYKKMPIRASIIYPYLAASGVTQIRDAGHDIQLIDCPTLEKTWKDIQGNIQAAEVVILEGRTPIIKEIWKAIDHLRLINPQIQIAVYGDHVSWAPYETIGKGADYILRGGDYDCSAAWLADILSRDIFVPHIIDVPLIEDLDSLPYVDRELVNWRNYYEAWKKRDVFLWIMSSRGCPYHCVYCAWAGTFWNYRHRQRSPQDVVSEFNMLFNRYGELEILDDADLFNFRFGKKLAQLLSILNYKKEILWSCQTHPAQILTVSQEDLKFMKAHGLSVVKLGIESSHDNSLKIMKKGATRRICEKAIKRLLEAGIMVHANMMIGFPWENKSDVLDSLEWLKKLDANQAQFSLVIPYPNTELWEMAEDEDWFIQNKMSWELYDASFPMLKMEGLSGEEIVDLYCQMWSGFYLNWKYIWRHLKTIRHWEGIKNLWKGFRSVYFGHMKAVDRKRKS